MQSGIIHDRSQQVDTLIKQLDTLSPLKVMARGFALVTKDEKVVSSTKQLQVGDQATIRFEDGAVNVTVKEIEKGNK